MRFFHNAALAACGVLIAGCAQVNVSEAVLSTNQKVAMDSTPGDSVSPPANLVLLANSHGQYVPVATGFGQAPVPALLNGAGAGIAVGAGIYGAAKVAKPPVTNVSNTVTGGTGGQGGTTNTNSTASTNTITQSGSNLSTGPQTATSSSTTTQQQQ
jgi:hypothetical protein